MNDTRTQIHISRPPGRFAVEITIYQNLQGGKIRAYQVSTDNAEKRGELVGTLYDVADAIPCTFELPEDQYRELLKSFAEEAKGQGIETHDSYVKGKLEATEHHLGRAEKLIDFLLPIVKKP